MINQVKQSLKHEQESNRSLGELVDKVICQFISGKVATVSVVRCGKNIRFATIYKKANQLSIKQAEAWLFGN